MGLRWDLIDDVELEEKDDESLHDSAVMHHLLALRIMKQDDRPLTEQSEGISPTDWMKEGTCLASSCGMEGHVGGSDHCLNTVSEQHCQLTKWYGRMSMSKKK